MFMIKSLRAMDDTAAELGSIALHPMLRQRRPCAATGPIR